MANNSVTKKKDETGAGRTTKSTKESNGRSRNSGRSTKREDEIRREIMDEVYLLMSSLDDKYPEVFVLDVILQGLDVEDGRTRVTIKKEHYKPMAEFEAWTGRPINDMLDEYLSAGIFASLSTDIEEWEEMNGRCMGIALPEHAG